MPEIDRLTEIWWGTLDDACLVRYDKVALLAVKPHLPRPSAAGRATAVNLPSHTGVAVVLLIALTWATSAAADSLLEVDHQKLVARADLTYERPVIRSEEGLPLGNGRMGSLVWTTPSALKLQINRVDVFASDSATDSFPERHTDYCGGCGFVDVDCVDHGNDVFPGDRTRQNLSCYDGLVAVRGRGPLRGLDGDTAGRVR